jgi:kumamolisin
MAKKPPVARGTRALAGSEKPPFREGRRVGAAPRDERITVTLRLRRKAPLPMPATGAKIEPVDYETFSREFGADPKDVAVVEHFASDHGLAVSRVSLGERAVDLSGTVAAMERAFSTKLSRYVARGRAYRVRSGTLALPAPLAAIVEGVFGLDDRPRVTPHFYFARRPIRGGPVIANARTPGFAATDVAALYNFPKGFDGTGQTIAILEFGGGYAKADLDAYFKKLKVKSPKVTAVSVDGASNAPTGDPNSADTEVSLDIEVAGAVAPGTQIAVYFAPNSDSGFINALYAAIHDNLRKPAIVSLSWGSPETGSTLQSLKDYDAACVDAAALGITICVAAGDHGSADSDPPGKRALVDFPASSPHVLACGGTRLSAAKGKIVSETVWNNGDGWASGGGVSEIFKLPVWQKNAGVPKSANPGGKVGRGVPDVTGNGDGETGYRILVGGKWLVVGGTSAVAPLWAGLIALLNQATKKRLGLVNPKLYALAPGQGFRDITSGNNGAYAAKPGWDPCSGLGSPDGEALRKAL